MISKDTVQTDIIDTSKVSTIKPHKQRLTPKRIARCRSIIADGSDNWESLVNTLEDARIANSVFVQGGTEQDRKKIQQIQETETQHVLRFTDESITAKTVQDVQTVIDELPSDTQDRLIKVLGTGLAENLVQRYGTAAPSILHKNCVERKPRDPVIMVNIKTGEVVFDHLDEFHKNPWGFKRPRPDSIVAALNGYQKWRNQTEWETISRIREKRQ